MNPTHNNGRQLAAAALAAGALAAAAIVGNTAQAAPVNVLNTAGTTLMGVDGIEFNGNAYNVRFVDGTCPAVFDGCTSNTNSFLFKTVSEATDATDALLAAMFPNALPSASNTNSGFFANNLPGRINGLGSLLFANNLVTPFAVLSAQTLDTVSAVFSLDANTNAFVASTQALGAFNRPVDLQHFDKYAYAKWSIAAPATSSQDVPEPGSLPLAAVGLGAAFLAAGKVRRRRVA